MSLTVIAAPPGGHMQVISRVGTLPWGEFIIWHGLRDTAKGPIYDRTLAYGTALTKDEAEYKRSSHLTFLLPQINGLELVVEGQDD